MQSTDVASAEAEEYYRELEKLHLGAFWLFTEAARPEPTPPEVPHVWRWKDLYPLLHRATDIVDVGGAADRRVLNLRNPGRPLGGATHSLTTSLQMILPGEVAPAHRHTAAALRFVIQGKGAYTVVEGEKIPMGEGDLILTPSWTWHDHGHEGSGPMVWLDGLDAPFVRDLRANFYEGYPGGARQPLDKPDADSFNRFGAGGLVDAKSRPPGLHSPLTHYRWDQAYEALQRLAASEPDRHDGTLLEYVNPRTGGHVLPTIACYLQLLKPGEHTRAHRHSSSTVYHVVRGSGRTIVNGQAFDWEKNDVIAVPVWAWHEHANDGQEEAILFSMSDAPLVEPFGLYREESYAKNGGHQQLDGPAHNRSS